MITTFETTLARVRDRDGIDPRMTATSSTANPAPSSVTAAFRADLHHVAMELGAKAQVCQERGQLTSAAKLRVARAAVQAALEEYQPARDERVLVLTTAGT